MSGSEAVVPAIILAAGESRRMGAPKQLLSYGGTHLLGHAILNAEEAGFADVHVVLGCHAEQIIAALAGFPARTIINQEWSEGMASSIRCGLASALETSPECGAVLLMLCDQPMLGVSHLRELRDSWLRSSGILGVASSNSEVLGAPAIFGRDLFQELREISGAAGARAVLDRHRTRIVALHASEMTMDIDTPYDYKQLRERTHC